MSRAALVVGSSVAGIQATLDLANSGIRVHLIEPSPFMGNSGATSVPRQLLNARLLEAAKHPNATVWTNTHINRIEGEATALQVEVRQHARYVDLARCTACGDCVDVCPVTVPGTGHKAIFLPESAQPGCATIDKVGKAPCANTCPGGIHVQGYVALIAEGRFQEALDLIRRAIPFPGICGRICTHPCELNCRRAEVDEAISIRLLKRFLADWELEECGAARATGKTVANGVPTPPPRGTALDGPPKGEEQQGEVGVRAEAKKALGSSQAAAVAVIGAGPAGMAVADNLARRGYQVTVFESQPVVGGMMAMGIPAYRLPREVIHHEIGRIAERGVRICLNTAIGPHGKYTLEDLFDRGYRAVFVGVGAHKGHNLRVPGEALHGVVSGIKLLKAINLSHETDDPRWQTRVEECLCRGEATRVAVIGGGNTAMDAARSLRRLGVKNVRILYRRTRAEMPAMPEEIEEAEHEGIPMDFLVSPMRVLGDEVGRVTALECVRMKLGEPDRSGRRRPVPIAGSEFTIDVDMLVPAIGQSPDLSFLGEDHGFAITREGTFNVDRGSFMTSRPSVFAAGDAITQPVSVIDAIASGKKAAAGIDAYLSGLGAHEVVRSSQEVPVSQRELAPDELVLKPRHASPTIPMDRRLSSNDEVELGYDAETAMAEARRCLMCGPCSECLACELVCEPGAILHEQQDRTSKLEIGALIWAGAPDGHQCQHACGPSLDGPASWAKAGPEPGQGIYHAEPGDPLAGSAAAARAMVDLLYERRLPARPARAGSLDRGERIGVFVCECNGQVSDVVDTVAVGAQASTWQSVAHVQAMRQSCSDEAAEAIRQAVEEHDLDRVVLGACSCCSVDQVCYGCTYQRVRCKDNLLGRLYDRGNPLFEFVNIREQCAWAYEDNPRAATAAASAMLAAGAGRARLAASLPQTPSPLEKTVLILGGGAAAPVCQAALSAQRVQALRVCTTPQQIRQTPSHFTVIQDGTKPQTGSALVLAPNDEDEFDRIKTAFGSAGRQPRSRTTWGSADTHRPGVFFCDPAGDTIQGGMAAAARVAAWLTHEDSWPETIAAAVDSDRCRGCGDCELVCEYGAIQLQPDLYPVAGREQVAWIDPTICRGGGVCVVRCPAGAIRAGRTSSAQIDAMLEAILA